LNNFTTLPTALDIVSGWLENNADTLKTEHDEKVAELILLLGGVVSGDWTPENVVLWLEVRVGELSGAQRTRVVSALDMSEFIDPNDFDALVDFIIEWFGEIEEADFTDDEKIDALIEAIENSFLDISSGGGEYTAEGVANWIEEDGNETLMADAARRARIVNALDAHILTRLQVALSGAITPVGGAAAAPFPGEPVNPSAHQLTTAEINGLRRFNVEGTNWADMPTELAALPTVQRNVVERMLRTAGFEPYP